MKIVKAAEVLENLLGERPYFAPELRREAVKLCDGEILQNTGEGKY